MFSLWRRRWFIYAKRWGWISSLVHFTIIGMIFHCDWTITAWQGQDMAHWTPSKPTHMREQASFVVAWSFHLSWTHICFLTLSLLGYFAFLHFTKLRTIGPQILIRKLSIFVPSLLSVNHVNVNKKVRNVQILLGQDLKTSCRHFFFINNTKRRSVLVSVLFVWRNFRC